jgi:hypothetical protein
MGWGAVQFRVIILDMASNPLLLPSVRWSLCTVLITGFFALQAAAADKAACAGDDGKTRQSQTACAKPDGKEKSHPPAQGQQAKPGQLTLKFKVSREEPSDLAEPAERENSQAPASTQTPQRQEDMDSSMFRR